MKITIVTQAVTCPACSTDTEEGLLTVEAQLPEGEPEQLGTVCNACLLNLAVEITWRMVNCKLAIVAITKVEI